MWTFLLILTASLQNVHADENRRMWNEGVDFHASGNEPFWMLDLDFDGSMRLRPLEAPVLSLSTPAAARAEDESVVRYDASGEEGSLVVELDAEECRDSMSGRILTHRVRVTVARPGEEPLSLEGCGRYVVDPRLEGAWVLQSIGGEDVGAAGLPKGAPMLRFDVTEMRVSGHGGCNAFTAPFRVEGRRITIGPVAATRMACPDMESEKRFFSALLESHAFELPGGRLVLEDDAPLIFLKKNEPD